MTLPPSLVPGSIQTPPFRPVHQPPSTPSPLETASEPWVEVLVSSCYFGLPVFLATLKELCLHPERNSSLILRADPLPAKGISPAEVPDGVETVEEVRVRLMPRQPKRDGKMDQRCLFFRQEDDPGKGLKGRGVVVYVPEVRSRAEQPYYYPPVRKLAYTWAAVEQEEVLLEGSHSDLGGQERSSSSSGNQPQADVNSLASMPPIETPPLVGRISIAILPWSEREMALQSATSDPSSTPSSLDNGHHSPFLPMRRSSAPRKSSPLAASSKTTTSSNLSPEASPDKDSLSLEGAQRQQEKLGRTCLALLERLYKHGYGKMVGYRKRINHDVIVSREPFQDLYLVLKERHRHLDSRAPKPGYSKVEDVKRHVFKDVGLPDDPLLPNTSLFAGSALSSLDLSEWGEQDVAVAAFLMLLWRDMYPARPPPDGDVHEEWDTWGRPEGGFVDLGCGNGLLVHVLAAEGYHGYGYELRARRTWPLYPPETQARLVELPISFPEWFPDSVDEWEPAEWNGRADCVIREECFIIGNHADEITPWIPLLSLIPSSPVPFLSLPCCAHTLDAVFTDQVFTVPQHPHAPSAGFDEGFEPGNSRYKAYVMWLGYVGLLCGWQWEKEGLRIPSTRGWGIVGRKRWAESAEQLRECREWALQQVQSVRSRGTFKVRVKEGKDH